MPASPERRGVFVTGTGTGVGKTVVAASIVAALAAGGDRVAAFKPVVTGLDEPDPEWPMDHELLSRAAGGWQPPADVAAYTFGPPVSPHFAAELTGVRIDPAVVLERYGNSADSADVVICEGVGGLMVPLSSDPPYSVLDLVAEIALPVVVAARAELGTISDTRLTVDRLRATGLDVVAVVFSPWPERPGQIHESNRRTVSELCAVEVHTIGHTGPDALAKAGDGLPVHDWVDLTATSSQQ